MVELVPAVCPKCGAKLQLPENLERAHCMYCGTEIIIELKKPDIHYHGVGSVENYMELGYIAMAGENYSDAVENYTKALQIDSNNEEAWLGKALAVSGLGNCNEAIACCDKAIAINPNGQGMKVKEICIQDHNLLVELAQKKAEIQALDDIHLQKKIELQDAKIDLQNAISNFKCFIATAAYGTPMAQEINVLREWRDETLMKTTSGRALIKIYYTISPPVADFISTSERLKAITRLFVNPFVHFAGVST